MTNSNKIHVLYKMLLHLSAPIFDGRFPDLWFRWLGWATLVAALRAVAERADSTPVHIIAWFSMFVFIIYIASRMEDWANSMIAMTGAASLSIRIIWTVAYITIVFTIIFALQDAIEITIASASDQESS